jgi:hypothetical protein
MRKEKNILSRRKKEQFPGKSLDDSPQVVLYLLRGVMPVKLLALENDALPLYRFTYAFRFIFHMRYHTEPSKLTSGFFNLNSTEIESRINVS